MQMQSHGIVHFVDLEHTNHGMLATSGQSYNNMQPVRSCFSLITRVPLRHLVKKVSSLIGLLMNNRIMLGFLKMT